MESWNMTELKVPSDNKSSDNKEVVSGRYLPRCQAVIYHDGADDNCCKLIYDVEYIHRPF